MTDERARKITDASMGRIPCDLVIRNAKVVNVYTQCIEEGDVFIHDGTIIGLGGKRTAEKEVDAEGMYMVPGLIDGHCHIESSHLSPTAFSDAVLPHGTTTVVADPHEICNVCGNDGMAYMLKSSRNAVLNEFLMYPSCVPATPFEHSGAILNAEEVHEFIDDPKVLGLGEMMNYPGIAASDETVYAKLNECYRTGKNIDGHAPGVYDEGLDAYIGTGITTDHECETPEDLRERVRRGMYVMLRQGTACKNVLNLLPGVDDTNWKRCMFCTDDRQPETIIADGHINHGVNLAIGAGLDPIRAITMATLNAAECYHLTDRGALAPGKRADFFLTPTLQKLEPAKVYVGGELVAADRKIIKRSVPIKPENVSGRMHVANFSADRLRLNLKSDHVRVIDIVPGGVVTHAGEATVKRDADGNWIHDPNEDILKLAVVERHHGTGNVATCLIRGYGMKHGAVSTSIAHDSHNIIIIGDNDEDMAKCVEELIRLGGGITMVRDGKVLDSHPLEIAGLMTGDSAEDVAKKLGEMHETAYRELEVRREIDPFMTLCFMALPVIPEYKLTDIGLFDVRIFDFVPNELD